MQKKFNVPITRWFHSPKQWMREPQLSISIYVFPCLTANKSGRRRPVMLKIPGIRYSVHSNVKVTKKHKLNTPNRQLVATLLTRSRLGNGRTSLSAYRASFLQHRIWCHPVRRVTRHYKYADDRVVLFLFVVSALLNRQPVQIIGILLLVQTAFTLSSILVYSVLQ